MTVFELIEELSNMPQDNIVVTRGSSPTTRVEATEVRVSRTKTKSIVYIGKPRPNAD